MKETARDLLLTSLVGLLLLASCRDAVSTSWLESSDAAFVSVQSSEIQEREFTRHFPLAQCTFAATGRTPYFILEPGHTLVLEDGKGGQLTISVLDQTEPVEGIVTRVVEERHLEAGALVEVSRNYFAICAENNSVFYFGEAVDNYKDGKIINHNGAWRHALDTRLRTPFGALDKVLVTRESTPLEPGVRELKSYAPGIGLVHDADLLLVSMTPGASRR